MKHMKLIFLIGHLVCILVWVFKMRLENGMLCTIYLRWWIKEELINTSLLWNRKMIDFFFHRLLKNLFAFGLCTSLLQQLWHPISHTVRIKFSWLTIINLLLFDVFWILVFWSFFGYTTNLHMDILGWINGLFWAHWATCLCSVCLSNSSMCFATN